MKKSQILLLLFFLLIPSLSFAQTSRSANAAANKSWPKFWREFRAAVNKRDRAALKRMMSARFNENCTLEGPPDTPDRGIEGLDQEGGWRRLQKLLSLGTKAYTETYGSNKGRPHRVIKGVLYQDGTLFGFGADGRWRWLGCVCWEC